MSSILYYSQLFTTWPLKLANRVEARRTTTTQKKNRQWRRIKYIWVYVHVVVCMLLCFQNRKHICVPVLTCFPLIIFYVNYKMNAYGGFIMFFHIYFFVAVSVSLLLLFRCTNGSVFSMPPIGYMVYVVIKQGKNQQQQLQQRLLKVNKSDRKINSTRNASNKSTKWGKKQQNSGKIGITRKRTTLWNIHIVFVFVFNAERDSSERGRQREKIHQINKL